MGKPQESQQELSLMPEAGHTPTPWGQKLWLGILPASTLHISSGCVSVSFKTSFIDAGIVASRVKPPPAAPA